MSIEIANESGFEVDADAIVAVARHTLSQMGVNPLAELSVLLVDSEYMAELNHRWMGKEVITRQALYLAAERGDFPSIRLGRRILIPKQAFQDFLLGVRPSKESAA